MWIEEFAECCGAYEVSFEEEMEEELKDALKDFKKRFVSDLKCFEEAYGKDNYLGTALIMFILTDEQIGSLPREFIKKELGVKPKTSWKNANTGNTLFLYYFTRKEFRDLHS